MVQLVLEEFNALSVAVGSEKGRHTTYLNSDKAGCTMGWTSDLWSTSSHFQYSELLRGSRQRSTEPDERFSAHE